jgi:selenide,water dikinase
MTQPAEGPPLLLTDFTQLKGCSCKIPQAKLLALLRAGGFDDADAALPPEIVACSRPGAGDDVGMDCSIEELRFRVPCAAGATTSAPATEPLFLISTTDFFFPSVEDARAQGAIGAANVVSDLCAMGIDRPDTVLMLLAASTEMDETERTAVTVDMLRGFNETVRRAGARVTGGQSVYNPWPLIGGTAVAVVPESGFIRPTGLRPGDVLVLTKPLGTQLGVNLRHWTRRPTRLYDDCIKGRMTHAAIDALYELSVASMRRLNCNGARLMRKYRAHGATDVTGFGLLGHTRNLAAAQPVAVHLVIDTLPILAGAAEADTLLRGHYKLLQGLSAETSGGLLVALESDAAARAFADELAQAFGERAWIVGRVEAASGDGRRGASIAGSATVVEVNEL